MRPSHRLQAQPPAVAEDALHYAPPGTRGRARFHDPSLTAMLALQCLMMFVAAPLAALGYTAGHRAVEILVLAFVTLVVVVSRSITAAAITVAGFICSIIGTRLQLSDPSIPAKMLMHVGGEVGIAVSGYIIARALYAPGRITVHRVLGAIVFYLNMGLFFATTYRLIRDAIPNALTGIAADADDIPAFVSMIYFSIVTLTSTGYGDIAPVHPIMRGAAMLEAVVGQLYPATLIARFVTQHMEHR